METGVHELLGKAVNDGGKRGSEIMGQIVDVLECAWVSAEVDMHLWIREPARESQAKKKCLM